MLRLPLFLLGFSTVPLLAADAPLARDDATTATANSTSKAVSAAIEPNTSPAADIVARLTHATAGDKPGLAVLVARDGKVLYEGTFGYADIAHHTPITPRTKFRIGSITKQFTAAAILRLAEQHKLALTDPLAKFFPDFPNGDKITLRHLLTHTSGIHSYTEKSELQGRVTQPVAPEDVVAFFRNDPPDFAPGAGFHYDNSGYFLLGMIVAKVSGKPYADFLRETFFDPLGMNDTGVYVNRTPPPLSAVGYSSVEGEVKPAPDWDMSWAGGAGSLYSTVRDLWRWNEALFGGRVVSPASFQAMTTPVNLPPDADGLRYGFGLIMSTHKGVPEVSHSGGLPGWLSDLVEFPAQHGTVVVLSNALPPLPNTGPIHLAVDLADRFLADDFKRAIVPQTAIAVDPHVFADYVGEYDYKRGIFTVTTDGDHLYGQLTGQHKLELLAKAPDRYFIKAGDAELEFLRDAQGKVVGIHHTQEGQSIRAGRLDGSATLLKPEQLDAFVGKYRYSPNAVLTVTRRGNYLFAQLTGQPGAPIFPVSASTFEWHIVKAKVEFVRDAAGKTIKAVHTQNGRTFEAPRIEE